MREPLDGDRVAVTDEIRDGVAHRRDLGGRHRAYRSAAAPGQPAASTSCSAPASTTSSSTSLPWPATCATASEKIRTRGVHLVGRHREGRRHADAGLAALEDEEPALEAGPLDLLGVLGRVELDAEHQAQTSDVADERREALAERGEPGLGLGPALGGVGDEAALEQVDRRERGGAGDRVAAVGGAVRAGPPRLEQVRPGDHRAERHPGRDALGGQQDVRLDAPVLDGPHLAGPPGARLDLVGDEQDAVPSQMSRRPWRKPSSGTR